MAGIYLGNGTSGFNISNNSAAAYGQAGTDQINIHSGATGIVTDQNIERVDLAGASSDYTFQQQGNQLLVYTSGTLTATIPVQGDSDGSQIVFTNGSVQAVLSAGVMTLGGTTVSTTAGAITPGTIDTATTSGVSLTPTDKAAAIYLETSDTGFHIINNGVTIYGQSGTDQAILHSGVTGVITDQNVERVDLEGAVSGFTFQQQGNQLLVYTSGTLTATIPVQGDSDGSQIVFTDGSVQAVLSAGVMTLGGTTVSTTAGAVTPGTIDTGTTWGGSSTLEQPPSPPSFTSSVLVQAYNDAASQQTAMDLIGVSDIIDGPMI